MRVIDADALINEFDQTFLGNNPRGVIRATIENAPTADVRENVRGEWILNNNGRYECSCCGVLAHDNDCSLPDTGDDPYCWNCGAVMRTTKC